MATVAAAADAPADIAAAMSRALAALADAVTAVLADDAAAAARVCG